MAGMLDVAPVEIVRQALIDLGVGTYPVNPQPTNAWPIYVGTEPTVLDRQLFLQETTGTLDVRTQPDSEWAEDYGVLLRVRAPTKTAAQYMAYRAAILGFDKMGISTSGPGNYVTVGGTHFRVYGASRTAPPIDSGKESPTSSRWIYTVNVLVNIDQVPG